jgi:hypothetical protein
METENKAEMESTIIRMALVAALAFLAAFITFARPEHFGL